MQKSKLNKLHAFIYLDKIRNEKEAILKSIAELPFPVNKVLEEYFIIETPSREIISHLKLTRNEFYKHLEKGKSLLRRKLNPGIYEKADWILYGKD